MTDRIPEAIRDLSSQLRRLSELVAWHELDRDQAGDGPGGYWSSSQSEFELKAAYGGFISVALDLQEALDHLLPDVPSERVARWQRRLRELMRQCHDLRIAERFIKP